MDYPSQHMESAVQALRQLPGIGPKSALRLALHLLQKDTNYTDQLVQSLQALRHQTRYCEECHHIAEATRCRFCQDTRRKHTTICIVESLEDVLAIEKTAHYRGLYHVLGNLIDPLAGIGPEDLPIPALVNRVKHNGVQEVIFALRATIEGDTTAFYLSKCLQDCNVQVSTLARGIAIGTELSYTDEVTLGRSLASRIAYHGQQKAASLQTSNSFR